MQIVLEEFVPFQSTQTTHQTPNTTIQNIKACSGEAGLGIGYATVYIT